MKFETGKTYTTRLIGDSNLRFDFEVLGRTAKTMVIGELCMGNAVRSVKRVKIRVDNNVETALPMGRYSMAPVIRADRISA